MRHEPRSTRIPSLGEALPEMVTIVEHRRALGELEPESKNQRKLKETVTVLVWEEADGTETIEVAGSSGCPPLEIKGLLHDGLYALTLEAT